MGYKIYTLLICLMLVVANGCDQNGALTEPAKSDTVMSQQSDKVTGPIEALAAGGETCGLIKASEVATIQGEKIIDTKPSIQHSDTFLVDQCYWVAAENAKSVVLSVYRADPANPSGKHPKAFWNERFSKIGKNVKENEGSKDGSGEAKKEKSTPPEPVKGLGDQAYWLDNKLGGALYVLHGDEFLRVSVGGTSDGELRISKAKSIAQAAIKRL